MDVIVKKSKISGEVESPPSKSYAHRLIIGAFLSREPKIIKNVGKSKDVLATLNCLKSLGLDYSYNGDDISLKVGELTQNAILDCNESGSTLRFLLPIVCALKVNATFTGKERLLSRPIDDLVNTLNCNGGKVNNFKVEGNLKSGEYFINANVSSQYITGLLFALPLLQGDSKIILQGKLVSYDYVNITLDVLKLFNVKIDKTEYGYYVYGNQKYSSSSVLTCEGDYSGSAFMLVAGALGDGVLVKNLNKNSRQGDRRIIEILKEFSAIVEEKDNGYFVKKGNLKGVTIDCEDIPDLVQIISVLASYSSGKTVLKNVSRLAVKESDRIEGILTNLKSANVLANYDNGNLTIYGGEVKSGKFLGFNDHRTVMSATILSAFCEGESVITDSEAVSKSYTNFFKDFIKIGGQVSGDF